MKRITPLILALILSQFSNSQSAEITIDGKFDDWNSGLTTFTDVFDSPSGIDLIECQVTNDEDFVYFHLIIDSDISLIDNLVTHDVRLYLDTDNDPSTGFSVQSGFVGSELGVVFRDRFAYYNVTPFSTVDLEDFKMRSATTYNGSEFEIAVGRDVIPDGINPLFSSPTIRVLFFDDCFDCDEMPNYGTVFQYTFDETPTTPYAPILLEKENPDYVRSACYNVQENLDNASLEDEFERIFQAMDADIIGFQEASGVTALEVKTLLDSWIPLGTVDGWYAEKDDWNLITASRYPIINSWDALDRHFATLIDLPIEYSTDLLFINAHLKCCGNGDVDRQAQVDEFASFILDAKSPGGSITLEDDTPFIFCGDMNLVGDQQQYLTIINGEIQDTGTWGLGGALDWDGSSITDACSIQADQRMAYSWRDDVSSYPPGRLDFVFYSDAVITVPKSYVLKTDIMSGSRLSNYGLNSGDTNAASDHMPVVADLSLIVFADDDGDGVDDAVDNCPGMFNPGQEDWNANGIGDHCEDADGDSVIDADELNIYNTDVSDSDSDNDGLDDGAEILGFGSDPLVQDTDGDGLTDGLEVSFGITDLLLWDSDGDGCDDASFFRYQCPGQNTDTCQVDTNGDGMINILDLLNISSAFGTNCP